MALKRPREETVSEQRVKETLQILGEWHNKVEKSQQQATEVAALTMQQCFFLQSCCANARRKQREEGQMVDKVCGIVSMSFSACPVHEAELIEAMLDLRVKFRNKRGDANCQSTGLEVIESAQENQEFTSPHTSQR